jgi:hypothetical protein
LAQEAEAQRERRARLIKAEAELEAAQKLKEAAGRIMENPAGLELVDREERRSSNLRLM